MEPDDRPDDRLDAQRDARLDEHLNELMDARRSSAGLRGLPAEDELAAPLAAALRLAPLREAAPSPEFARILEQQLIARADHQRAVQESRQTSRQASVTAASGEVEAPHVPEELPAARERTNRWRNRTPRALWPLLAASILLALGVGTFSASAHADPSSPLYGLHRTVENAEVQLASSQQQRFQLHLQYANEALNALDDAAHAGNAGAYATALSTLQSELAAAKQALAMIPAGSDADTLANQLSDLQTRSWQDLASHLRGLNWANRVATTSAMGTLGAAIPRVTAAAISSQDGQSQGSGQDQGNSQPGTPRSDQVVVSGSGFEAGATLVANGQPVGHVTGITITPGRIVASVPRGELNSAQSIGVSNPDGSAAQTSNISGQQGNGNGGDNGNNGNGKHPTPTATPDHGHDKHP